MPIIIKSIREKFSPENLGRLIFVYDLPLPTLKGLLWLKCPVVYSVLSRHWTTDNPSVFILYSRHLKTVDTNKTARFEADADERQYDVDSAVFRLMTLLESMLDLVENLNLVNKTWPTTQFFIVETLDLGDHSLVTEKVTPSSV